MEDDLGIPDREPWLLRPLHAAGTARGWRRRGCIGALVVGAVACLAAVVVALALATADDDDGDRPCDELAVRAAYLEAIDAPPPAAQAELTDIDAQLAELDC